MHTLTGKAHKFDKALRLAVVNLLAVIRALANTLKGQRKEQVQLLRRMASFHSGFVLCGCRIGWLGRLRGNC